MLFRSILQLENDVSFVSGDTTANQLLHRQTKIFQQVRSRPIQRLADSICVARSRFNTDNS
jgi:hypothetical protein